MFSVISYILAVIDLVLFASIDDTSKEMKTLHAIQFCAQLGYNVSYAISLTNYFAGGGYFWSWKEQANPCKSSKCW